MAWFDDERITGLRGYSGRSQRRVTVLSVNTRLGRRKKSGFRRVGVIVLIVVVVSFAGGLLYAGVCKTGDLLFSANDRFMVRDVEVTIREGSVVRAADVRKYTGIREGVNLFALDLKRISRDFLRLFPNVREIEISRCLPDLVRIEVSERVPVARMEQRGHLVTDADGVVFGLDNGRGDLPSITGYRDTPLAPRTHVRGMALAAIDLLQACEDPRLGFRIENIDVRNREHLVVRTLHSGRQREVILNWEGMEASSPESRWALQAKLSRVAATFLSREGRKLRHLDATFDDRVVGS